MGSKKSAFNGLMLYMKCFLVLCIFFSNVVIGQTITTFGGIGAAGNDGDGGPATSAKIYNPTKCCFDSKNNSYVNVFGNVIRKIESGGIISTIVGDGVAGFSGDGGYAITAQIKFPTYVAVDKNDNIYISDAGNYRIRKIDANTGIITTVAGNGVVGYSSDGTSAIAASLSALQGITFDNSNNLYFCDGTSRIRKIDAAGILSTIAGNGIIGFGGDNGPATAANLSSPTGLSYSNNNLYIADWSNLRIRKVNLITGIITTVAGNGSAFYNGDDIPATSAAISPRDIAVHPSGDLLIADYTNQRIRKINTSGYISTIAGNGTLGYNGDNILGYTATLNDPSGVSIDSCGNIYIADNHNSRIRKITFSKCNYLDAPTVSENLYNLPIYPIPAIDFLKIDNLKAATYYTLLSIVGSTLLQGQLHSGSNTLSLSGLPAGMYLLQLNDENQKTTHKIFKQ